MWNEFEELPRPRYGLFVNGSLIRSYDDVVDALDDARRRALELAHNNEHHILYEDENTFELRDGTVIRVAELR